MTRFRHINRTTRVDCFDENHAYIEPKAALRARQDLALAVEDCRSTDDVQLIAADQPRRRRTPHVFGSANRPVVSGLPKQTRSRRDGQGISSPFDGSALDRRMYGNSPEIVLGLGARRVS